MSEENAHDDKIDDATSEVFTQAVSDSKDANTSQVDSSPSLFSDITDVEPTEEGIEISQPTESEPAVETSAAEDYTAELDRDSTSQPPGHAKSLITKISWPDPEHFHSDESIVLVDNPNIFKSLDKYLAGAVIALVGLFLSGHYLTGATNEYLQNDLPFGIQLYATRYYLYALLLVVLFGVSVILWAHIQRLHTWYFVTNQRSWVRSGVFSQRDLGDLDHAKVNNVEEENPFPMNRWDVGHIRLFTAASDGSELEFGHVKEPTVWKSRVRDSMMLHKEENVTSDQYTE